jgi:hypothetical protein
MLNKVKNPAANNQLIFFSDEKNFSQNQTVNKKNNRVTTSTTTDMRGKHATFNSLFWRDAHIFGNLHTCPPNSCFLTIFGKKLLKNVKIHPLYPI